MHGEGSLSVTKAHTHKPTTENRKNIAGLRRESVTSMRCAEDALHVSQRGHWRMGRAGGDAEDAFTVLVSCTHISSAQTTRAHMLPCRSSSSVAERRSTRTITRAARRSSGCVSIWAAFTPPTVSPVPCLQHPSCTRRCTCTSTSRISLLFVSHTTVPVPMD